MPDITVQDLIRQEAKKAGIPEAFALAVAEQESGFNPGAEGPEIAIGGQKVRAKGVFQFIPSTAQRFDIDPSDPTQNVQAGIRYLRELLDKHQGDPNRALAEYGGVRTNTTYVPEVLARIGKFNVPQAQPTSTTTPARSTPLPPSSVMPGAIPQSRTTDRRDPKALVGGPPEWLKATASTFDPRTPEGQQNLVAGAGAMLLSRGTAALPWAVRTAAPILGAALGGATTETVQQTVGTRPPDPNAVTAAGKTQAINEVIGRSIWPVVTAPVKILRGSAVGKAVGEALHTGKRGIASEFTARINAASDFLRTTRSAASTRSAQAAEVASARTEGIGLQFADALGRTRGEVAESIRGARAVGEVNVRRAEEAAAGEVGRVEVSQRAQQLGLEGQYAELLRRPPSSTQAGQAVQAVLEGPAKTALDQAGEAVSQSAIRGPMVKTAGLQQKLNQMVGNAQPSFFTGGKVTKNIGYLEQARYGPQAVREAAAATVKQSDDAALSEATRRAARILGLPEEEAAKHPLTGVLREIQQAPEAISFADAHKLKRLLDEAVNWESPAKKHVQQITKGIRAELRRTMSGYKPYDQATAAYEMMLPLYRKGAGKQMAKGIIDNPDAVARTIKRREPWRATLVKDLLIKQAAEGGDEALGREAFDRVRSVWTHENIVQGGLKGLVDRVRRVKESQEFAATMFGDGPGAQILDNLELIGQAYRQLLDGAAVQQAKVAGQASIVTAKDVAKSAAREAQRVGEERLIETDAARRAAIFSTRQIGEGEQARIGREGTAAIGQADDLLRGERRGKVATEATLQTTADEFNRSSLANFAHGTDMASFVADIGRMAALGSGSRWTWISAVHLLTKGGPKAEEIVRWAAYTGQTERLVQFMANPLVKAAAGGLPMAVRGTGLANDIVGIPPPRSVGAGPVNSNVATRPQNPNVGPR